MDIINPYIHGGESVPFDGFGNASRSFNGTSDYLDLGDSDDFSFGDGSNDLPFSISVWVKLDDMTGSNKSIISKLNAITDGEYLLFYNSSNEEFRFSIYDGSQTAWIRARSSVINNENEWYHLVVTYDGSKLQSGLKMYINGSLDTLNDSSDTYYGVENTIAPLQVGTYDSTNYFEGNIADVRLYDAELSSSDVSELYSGTNVTTNLVGHWIKDTPSLLDHAGNNDATNYGSKFSYNNPSPAVEFGSMSRIFNGNSDHVDLGNSTDFSFSDTVQDEPFSLCAWIKCDSNSKFRVLSKDNGAGNSHEWLLATDAAGLLTIYLVDGGTFRGRRYTTSPLPENEWVHVASTYDGSGGTNFRLGLKLYVNGVQVDDTDHGTASGYDAMEASTNNKVFIGRWSTTYSDGKIADARIYDAELSSTDISDIYNGTNVTTNLIGHWLTNNDDADDYAGTNDGTNYGSTYSYDNPNALVEYGGASRNFTGSSQYVDLGNVLDNVFTGTGKQWSFTAWVKADTLNDRLIFSKWHNTLTERAYFIRITSSGDLAFNFSSDGTTNNRWGKVTNTSPIGIGSWHHVAVSYDQTATGNYLRLWVDGVEDTNPTDYLHAGTVTSIYDGNATIQISGINGTNSQDFDGKIADVRVYDTDLSSTEVYELYKGVDHRTNLIGQWLTNSDDVEDKAGTNDGTNNGSTYSTDSPL